MTTADMIIYDDDELDDSGYNLLYINGEIQIKADKLCEIQVYCIFRVTSNGMELNVTKTNLVL